MDAAEDSMKGQGSQFVDAPNVTNADGAIVVFLACVWVGNLSQGNKDNILFDRQ